MELAAPIRQRAVELGFDLVGFGPAEPFARERELILEDLARGRLEGLAWITAERVRLSCDPQALLPRARTIVALGTAYGGRERGAEVSDGLQGRVARYAWGRDYHEVIPPRLRALASAISDLAGPDVRCRSFVDTGPLVDRAAAERAGIGFVGKNTCILTGRHGSYVFLSAILTTAEIAADPFAARDCGSCRACLDACPTGAFVAPRQLDATRCVSYLTIEHRGWIPQHLRPGIGDWVFGCDVCQEVCPWNRARPGSAHDQFGPEHGAGPSLDLITLLSMDESAFRSRFRGTPLTRPKRAGLLRNAAIVLGNLGDRAAVEPLVSALEDPDALVRGHAAWALGRMAPLPPAAIAALERALDEEPDEQAAQEIAAALAAASPLDREPAHSPEHS